MKKEDMDHLMGKHRKQSGIIILILTLLNTKNYSTNFEKLSSLLGVDTLMHKFLFREEIVRLNF